MCGEDAREKMRRGACFGLTKAGEKIDFAHYDQVDT